MSTHQTVMRKSWEGSGEVIGKSRKNMRKSKESHTKNINMWKIHKKVTRN